MLEKPPTKVCGECGKTHDVEYFFESHGENGLAFCSKQCSFKWVLKNNVIPFPPTPQCRTYMECGFGRKRIITWKEKCYERSKKLWEELLSFRKENNSEN